MNTCFNSANRPVRVGAVSYLNTKPLIEGLSTDARVELILDLPSRLADALAADRLDVALIPSVELFQHRDYTIVSDACIACRGPVMSVRLFFRVPPNHVKTLALDEGSRTSRILSQLMIRELTQDPLVIENLPIGCGLDATQADAVLLIGDRAMRALEKSFVEIWDLGDRWWRLRKLPFVFAIWAARPGFSDPEIGFILAAARDRGIANIESIADRESRMVDIPRATCKHYLSHHLHFTFKDAERQSLSDFYKEARQRNLVPEGWSGPRNVF
ncbi:MAG: menaquinone biosynthesis protein [Pirellulales bacterium]|nr:menaquinone biosynthesis protein [Pirellulales bacterium]